MAFHAGAFPVEATLTIWRGLPWLRSIMEDVIKCSPDTSSISRLPRCCLSKCNFKFTLSPVLKKGRSALTRGESTKSDNSKKMIDMFFVLHQKG